MLIGIDVSRWQGVVPWSDVAAAGVGYAWIKATHGLSSTPDPQWARNWEASRDELRYGRGAYHWLTDSDPELQVERVVRQLAGAGYLGELHVAIDWEEPSTTLRGEALVLHALRALRRTRELAGGALVYTGAWYVEQFVAPDRDLGRVVSRELLDELVSYPLWHAQYPRVALADRRACATQPPALPQPRLPKPWRDRGIAEAVWQWDGDGGCTLPNGVDADFNLALPSGLERCRRVELSPATLPSPPLPEMLSRLDDGPATPLRAGEGEHTVALAEWEDVT